MRRNKGPTGAAAALGLGLLLGGCGAFDRGTAGLTNGLAGVGNRLGAPWGGTAPAAPEQSITAARLTGAEVPLETLQVEPGNVWPEQEAPRATLANPDAAMRNIPAYRPGELDRMSAPAGRSTWQPEDPPAPRPLPPELRGSSTPPPPPPQAEPFTPRARAQPPAPIAPPPRLEGQVLQTPSGPVITGGGTDRVQTGVPAGGGPAVTIHRDGNVTTISPPGRPPETILTPR